MRRVWNDLLWSYTESSLLSLFSVTVSEGAHGSRPVSTALAAAYKSNLQPATLINFRPFVAPPLNRISSQSKMTSAQPQPTAETFRFLDLPLDIRLMVYERLPHTTEHFSLTTDEPDPDRGYPGSSVTFITRSTPTSILSTCRQIFAEANPFVQRSITNWVMTGGLKIVASHDQEALEQIAYYLGLVYNETRLNEQCMGNNTGNLNIRDPYYKLLGPSYCSAPVDRLDKDACREWIGRRERFEFLHDHLDDIVGFIYMIVGRFIRQSADLSLPRPSVHTVLRCSSRIRSGMDSYSVEDLDGNIWGDTESAFGMLSLIEYACYDFRWDYEFAGCIEAADDLSETTVVRVPDVFYDSERAFQMPHKLVTAEEWQKLWV
jgi:hypothetical protein